MIYNQYHHYNSPTRAPFSNLIGQFYTIANPIPLMNGYVIPQSTRVFIHTVTYLPSGEESVTIVFPMQSGGTCVSGATKVNASQLLGSPVQTIQ
ncbi:hypothetical protein [Paenibacillus apiarius]|uniref:Uncharacterized protein n=1 Tax=Paenibacillus apiarius TaxID=46240 RepID=A0ABT4DMR2_9BACL|nr:hypothetical protein [Paenibacillus apiarius]MCY9516025.1 hypothetical protein [Paenibacillus apiarius]MCY9518516.1 hypothetical protein [Paenibacillus apiarius]MCY9551083.1 hypothetical protein [Paenibacillus apiarius]MCY9558237.1 hypothetical protein [Paenibacillus apiarius]MCY9684637.1 hypothetical protein [Paenibacillus apiarius]